MRRNLSSIVVTLVLAPASALAIGLLAPTSSSAATPVAAVCYPTCTSTPPAASADSLRAADGASAVAAASDGSRLVSASSASTLAFTGADVAGTAAVGSAAVVAGVVLVRAGRRRSAS